MPIYEVEVTEERRVVIFVEADSEREAEDAAADLTSVLPSDHWDVDDSYDSAVVYLDRIPKGSRIWVGGAKGDWQLIR